MLSPTSLPVRGAWIEITLIARIRRLRHSSLPVRGAWIEIVKRCVLCIYIWSLPVRGAWIEMLSLSRNQPFFLSLPVRGAWIEISSLAYFFAPHVVAPRAGSVD